MYIVMLQSFGPLFFLYSFLKNLVGKSFGFSDIYSVLDLMQYKQRDEY